jgi:hypothetical protein
MPINKSVSPQDVVDLLTADVTRSEWIQLFCMFGVLACVVYQSYVINKLKKP